MMICPAVSCIFAGSAGILEAVGLNKRVAIGLSVSPSAQLRCPASFALPDLTSLCCSRPSLDAAITV